MATDPNDSPKKDWRTAPQLARHFVGSHPGIGRRMVEIRQKLIADTIAAGFSQVEAAVLIDDHMIRMQEKRTGDKQPAASQDAVRLLGLTERAHVEPTPPEGWISAAQLGQQLGIDDHQAVVRVARFYLESVAALHKAGYSENEAATTVENSLIRRLQATQGRRRIWHLSPDAVNQIRAIASETAPTVETPEEVTWPRRWTFLLRSLVTDMTRNGYSSAEATKAIQNHLATKMTQEQENPAQGRR